MTVLSIPNIQGGKKNQHMKNGGLKDSHAELSASKHFKLKKVIPFRMFFVYFYRLCYQAFSLQS